MKGWIGRRRPAQDASELTNEHHESSTFFLQTVCDQIRSKPAHREVRRELEGHLNEIVDELVSEGIGQAEAERIAVERMGDPRDIGRQLNQVHKPVIAWGLVGLLTALLSVGLFFMYILDLRMDMSFANTDMFSNQVVFALLGMIVAGALWFFDYRILLRKGWIMYGAAVSISFLMMFAGPVNGSKAYLYFQFGSFNAMMLALFLFIISNATMTPAREWTLKLTCYQLMSRMLVPILLFMSTNTLSMLALYLVTFFVQVWLTRKNIWQPITYAAILSLAGLYVAITQPYTLWRWFSFLKTYEQGGDYLVILFKSYMQQAGWLGNGPVAFEQQLPYLHSEGMFTLMVHTYGWLTGIGFAVLVLSFIVAMLKIGSKVREPFGKRLIYSLVSVVALQFVWSILMTLGWAPFVGISMPFVSYGGSSLLLHMMVFGLVLSVAKQQRSPHYGASHTLAR
ncbi:FtsW/RodA/SpoVE family cell cycle protein [Paenibacillus daejeonensis]|uniref:FtsW/RodA/SpoVE family cell cycle protein n=1 Tax=Paenibacillus daejeonensis TaxID=135193 RepID=UPI000379A4E5|nr:FtsW/RodA/SpoVE family cell cycle protein [Paenibacillus daejeonensis]